MASSSAPRDRIPLPVIFAFVSCTVPAVVLMGMLGAFMPRYFAGHMGLPLLAVGAIMASVGWVTTLVDLPMGWLMDHTKTPIGRYRPWYVVGAPVLMVGIYMLFDPPKGMTSGYLFIWSLVVWLGISMVSLSYSAWAANLATSYNERTRLFGWVVPAGVIGSMGLYLLPAVTHDRIGPGNAQSVPLIGMALIVMTVVMTIFVCGVTPERVTQNVKRDKVDWREYWSIIARPTALRLVFGDLFLVMGPAMLLPIYLFFFKDAKGFTISQATTLLVFNSVGPLIGAPMWARVAKRVGKHRTIQVASLCYIAALAGVVAVPAHNYWATAAAMAVTGLCGSAFLFLGRAMLGDYGDQLRLEQGVQRVGLLYSFVSVTMKLGNSITALITFGILQFVGYRAADTAVNTPQAIHGLMLVYFFGPVIPVLLGSACFFGYELDAKRHDEIRAALEARDADPIDSNPVAVAAE
jgi:GPH family glycoside/pentoside/hexuronide:cation symporter